MDNSRYGVIFDMDGVLADTARAHFKTWQQVGAEWGVEVTWEVFDAAFGRPNHQTIPEMFGRGVAEDEIREIDRLKEEAFRDTFGWDVAPLPGVVALVRGLHRTGYRLAVGSSGPRENIELVLNTLRIAPCFSVIVSGWDVERGKPHPEVFLKAADGMGVEPDMCLVIEDVPAGIQAARAAGMKCVAVASTRPVTELVEADQVVERLEEVSVADIATLLARD
ncbi:MAG: HAD family hydrolase [Planctomycetota bacterium]